MTGINTASITQAIRTAIKPLLLTALVLPFSAGLEVTVFESQVAQAQNDAPKKKTRRVESIRAKHVKTFEKVSEAFDNEDVPAAKALLNKLAKETDLNNIETAYLSNFRGSICLNEDNLNCALREFKKVANLKEGISEGFQNQMLYQVAQVLFLQEKYREALQYAQRWFRTQEDPSADAYMLIGQAHYQLKEYDKALPNVQKGIKKYEELGSTPKEGWLNLLSNIYREKGQYRKMLPVVKQLVKHYPKKNYLLSLGYIFNELEDLDSMSALYLAMYDQGLLKSESELNTVASLMMNLDNPYKASKIMEKGFADGTFKKTLKNYRSLSQALYAAREYEKALDPLSQAAKLSKDGKLDDQLGQAHINLNQWRNAETALKRALNKGKLRDTGQTTISLGLVQFELNRPQEALKTFNKALRYDKVAGAANNWIKYVNAEVQREAELKKEIVINTDVEPLDT